MEKVRKKKMQVREKVGKPSIHSVFPMICGSGGSKRNLAKAAGAEPAGQMRAENLHAIVARSTFRSQNVQSTQTSDHFWKLSCRKSARPCGAKHISSQNVQAHHSQTTFGRSDVEKSARRCGAKHISKSTVSKHEGGSDHFLTFRCRKSVRPCGAKHISKSKVSKHEGFGPLVDVQMSKKCALLWRESTFPSQKCQSTRVRTTFGRSEVEKVDTD